MSDPDPVERVPSTPVEPVARKRYVFERRLVGVLFFAVTGAVIVNGAIRIGMDTYRTPSTPPPSQRCSDGIALLYTGFVGALNPVRHAGEGMMVPARPLEVPAEMAVRDALDEKLLALRPICDREGADARDAYQALTLWRHQSEDQARVEERVLTPDAERALRYQSPGARVSPHQDTSP